MNCNLIQTSCLKPILADQILDDGQSSLSCLKSWLINHHAIVQEALANCGGLYFKGFSIETAEQFDEIATLIEPDLVQQHVLDGDTCTWVTPHVYIAASPAIKSMRTPLSIHHEDSFAKKVPKTILFCMIEPAPSGGENLLTDGRHVYQALPESLKKKLESSKIKSIVTLKDKLLLVNGRIPKNEQAIIQLAQDLQADQIHRIDDETTSLTFHLPTITQCPHTAAPVWFNILHQSHFINGCHDIWKAYQFRNGFLSQVQCLGVMSQFVLRSLWQKTLLFFKKSTLMLDCQLGENQKLSWREQLIINRTIWQHTEVIKLAKGDFIVLNNRIIAHGRMPYRGRRLLLSCIGPYVTPNSDSATGESA